MTHGDEPLIKDASVQAVLVGGQHRRRRLRLHQPAQAGQHLLRALPLPPGEDPLVHRQRRQGPLLLLRLRRGRRRRPLRGAHGEPVLRRGHRAAGRALRRRRWSTRRAGGPTPDAQGPGGPSAAGARQGGHVLPALPVGIRERARRRGSISRSAGLGRGGLRRRSGWASRPTSGGDCTAGRPRRGSPTANWRRPGCWCARRARRTTASAAG